MKLLKLIGILFKNQLTLMRHMKHSCVSVTKTCKCFKYKTVKALKKGRKQWMTQECLQMIEKKNLYVKFVRTKETNDLSEFKRYRNFVTKYSRKTKDAYYEAIFKGVSTRGDVLWGDINKLLNSGSSRNNALELNIDDKMAKD